MDSRIPSVRRPARWALGGRPTATIEDGVARVFFYLRQPVCLDAQVGRIENLLPKTTPTCSLNKGGGTWRDLDCFAFYRARSTAFKAFFNHAPLDWIRQAAQCLAGTARIVRGLDRGYDGAMKVIASWMDQFKDGFLRPRWQRSAAARLWDPIFLCLGFHRLRRNVGPLHAGHLIDVASNGPPSFNCQGVAHRGCIDDLDYIEGRRLPHASAPRVKEVHYTRTAPTLRGERASPGHPGRGAGD